MADIATLTEKYIALRDKKAAMKKAYETEAEKITAIMDKVEGVMLQFFQETGSDSIKTPSGTAYKSERNSYSVADWSLTFEHIQANGNWHMLEKRVNKAAVDAYKEETGTIPPGLNARSEVVVNIRRS